MVSLLKYIAGDAIFEFNLPGSRGSYAAGISLFFIPLSYQLSIIQT